MVCIWLHHHEFHNLVALKPVFQYDDGVQEKMSTSAQNPVLVLWPSLEMMEVGLGWASVWDFDNWDAVGAVCRFLCSLQWPTFVAKFCRCAPCYWVLLQVLEWLPNLHPNAAVVLFGVQNTHHRYKFTHFKSSFIFCPDAHLSGWFLCLALPVAAIAEIKQRGVMNVGQVYQPLCFHFILKSVPKIVVNQCLIISQFPSILYPT